MSQKSIDVLRRIRAFLATFGIYSTIYTFRNGVNSLEVGRADDLIRFLSSLNSIVKRKQVSIALLYLQGQITGNKLLQTYDKEYLRHKRKNSPLINLGLRFPMTRTEAVKAAVVKSEIARFEGNKKAYAERMDRRLKSLPEVFGVKDIQRIVGVSKPRAQVLGQKFESLGLVTSHFEKVPPRFRKKVFVRLSR